MQGLGSLAGGADTGTSADVGVSDAGGIDTDAGGSGGANATAEATCGCASAHPDSVPGSAALALVVLGALVGQRRRRRR